MSSMFDDGDEFGIQQYREDCNYLMQLNEISVIIKRKSKNMLESRQGDFLGIKTKTYEAQGEVIKINIMSISSENKTLKRDGYQNIGKLEYDCVCAYDVDINNKDEITLIEQHPIGIKAGEVFKVEMGDVGLYKMQYTRKFFKLVKISEKEL